jgi:hypothetical protein
MGNQLLNLQDHISHIQFQRPQPCCPDHGEVIYDHIRD